MKKPKSPARLQWEEEYRERRAQAKWEEAEEFLARNPMCLSPRAMSSSAAGLVPGADLNAGTQTAEGAP